MFYRRGLAFKDRAVPETDLVSDRVEATADAAVQRDSGVLKSESGADRRGTASKHLGATFQRDNLSDGQQLRGQRKDATAIQW